MVTAKPHLLLIADLRHASPRWPALAGGLLQEGWRVTVLTAPIGDDAPERLGFPMAFSDAARIVECGPAEDIFQPLRNVLWALGLRRGTSLTSQLKAQLPGRTGGARGVFELVFHTTEALLGWPDAYARWRRPATAEALRLVALEEFSVMVSSSPYPTSHAVAAAVKRKNPALRWVADFRDLWSQNHGYAMPQWRKRADAYLERRLLALAEALVTTSEEWARILNVHHGKPVAVIRNSFVDYEAPQGDPPPTALPLMLSYTGVRYPRQQRIAPVLHALALLRQRGCSPSDVRLNIVGPHDLDLAEQASTIGVQDSVAQRGPVSRRAAQRAQRAAHVLLYLQWEDPSVDMVSSLKFWEYLGSGRPMLLTGGHPNGSAERIATEVNAGVIARNANDIADALLRWIEELRHRGHVDSGAHAEKIARLGTRAILPDLRRVLLPDTLS